MCRTCYICGAPSEKRVCEECENSFEDVNSSVINRLMHSLGDDGREERLDKDYYEDISQGIL